LMSDGSTDRQTSWWAAPFNLLFTCGNERAPAGRTDTPPSSSGSNKPLQRGGTKPSGRQAGHWSALDKRLKGLQRFVADVGGEGNCLFLSLSDQLYGDNGKKHKDVRRAVVDWLQAHGDSYRPSETDGEVVLREYVTYSKEIPDWAAYIKHMRSNGSWGDHLCLTAAANVFSCKVCIFSTMDDGRDIEIRGSKHSSRDPAVELGHSAEWHYCSVRSGSQNPPPLVLQAITSPSMNEAEPKAVHQGFFQLEGEKPAGPIKQASPQLKPGPNVVNTNRRFLI